MDKKVISREFNIDTACVEVRYTDGSMLSIDCSLVKAEAALKFARKLHLSGVSKKRALKATISYLEK